MARVRLSGLTKKYNDTVAVRDVNLEIDNGEFIALVGPSGCGKTTILRMIAGLEEITQGELYINDQLVNSIAPKDRDIAMVFQNYALYAHMTVENNIAFGLKLRKVPRAELKRRTLEAARIVGMEEYLSRKPGALSGGQRQRVALARAIVRNPGVFLFDEPLSNLDAKLRLQMRMEISSLQRKLKATTIYVTHDQVEAMTMADKIAVLNNGELQQFGNPLDLYQNPVNEFVAAFIGSPAMNILRGNIDVNNQFAVQGSTIKIPVPGYIRNQNSAGDKLSVGIRPEKVFLDKAKSNGRSIEAELSLQHTEVLGNESIIHLLAGQQEVIARTMTSKVLQTTGPIKVFLDVEDLYFFDGATGDALNTGN